ISLLLIVFLISGLSWSGIWGERFVQAWSTFPAEKWSAPPSHDIHASMDHGETHDVPVSDDVHASMNHGAAKEVPWGLEQTPLPASGSLAGTPVIDGAVDIDSVAAFARGLGFNHRFQINLP